MFSSCVGVYEVGVHIADVSYFVKEGTALDQVASERATSVYLVQRVSGLLIIYTPLNIGLRLDL